MIIGGGLVGVETAEYLAKAGCEVTIVEMLDAIAKEESGTILPTLTEELDNYGVIRHTHTKLDEIHPDFVTVTTETEDTEPKTFEIPADFVVMAVGARKQLQISKTARFLSTMSATAAANDRVISNMPSKALTIRQMHSKLTSVSL